MKHVTPFIIIGASFVLFLVLGTGKPNKDDKPGFFRRIWRRVVAIFDFLTNFG